MGQAIGSLLGIKQPKAPEPVAIIPTPDPEKAKSPVDEEGAKLASERIAQEKLRRGRNSLRTNLDNPGYAGGSGVAIPT
jgi:hypothetical protein